MVKCKQTYCCSFHNYGILALDFISSLNSILSPSIQVPFIFDFKLLKYRKMKGKNTWCHGIM